MSHYILEMVQARTIVIVEYLQEVVCSLSNRVSSDNLEWYWKVTQHQKSLPKSRAIIWKIFYVSPIKLFIMSTVCMWVTVCMVIFHWKCCSNLF